MPNFYLHFVPVARLQKILGRELIADPNVAVAELVKNAYDAGASQVRLDFAIAGTDPTNHRMVIADDGSGMDQKSFTDYWMKPGFSDKAPEAGYKVPLPTGLKNQAATRAKSRAQTGEKGLGRLSVARLADRVEIRTRARKSDPWLVAEIDWDLFDTMDKDLADIQIPVHLENTWPSQPFPTGTVLTLSELRVDWSAKIPGRRVPGRSAIRLGRLKEDLQLLVLPLAKSSNGFGVTLAVDSEELKTFAGRVDPLDRMLEGYEFEFAVTTSGQEYIVTRSLRRSKEVASKTKKPREWVDEFKVGYSALKIASGIELQSCGPFSGKIYYAPSLPRKEFGKAGVPGVLLYRDRVRVDPYGLDGNDWLEVTAWKASRQGHAPIQPNQLVGYVSISSKENPELRDMSNRQGLIENDEYELFLTIIRNEFKWFGDTVYEEYVQYGWEPSEEKLMDRIEKTQQFSRLLLQELTHSIRQSTGGLGAEMMRLSLIADGQVVVPDVNARLRDISERSGRHIRRIDEVVAQALTLGEKELESIEKVSLVTIVDDVIRSLKTLAESLGVSLVITEQVSTADVTTSRMAIQQALSVLGQNAIEASSANGQDQKWVKFSTERYKGEAGRDDGWRITLKDNGRGMSAANQAKVFTSPFSTKGHQGTGLIRIHTLLSLLSARVELVKSGDTGTMFAVYIPQRPRMRE